MTFPLATQVAKPPCAPHDPKALAYAAPADAPIPNATTPNVTAVIATAQATHRRIMRQLSHQRS
jgi:hypothetical protein